MSAFDRAKVGFKYNTNYTFVVLATSKTNAYKFPVT
jgi:hypothetical protein